jgi:NAD(P)-dependent dehydrogenase (short-subunit alcohol dehydrogenase family)
MNASDTKVAIVTGGASGIGQALCEELAKNGAMVMVGDINFEGARQVASSIEKAGGCAQAAHVDVCKAEAVRALVDGTVSRFGRLDYLFNNAGTNVAGEVRDLRLDHWRRIVDTNL